MYWAFTHKKSRVKLDWFGHNNIKHNIGRLPAGPATLSVLVFCVNAFFSLTVDFKQKSFLPKCILQKKFNLNIKRPCYENFENEE